MKAVWALTWTEMIRKRVTFMTLAMTALFGIAFWFISDAIIGDPDYREQDSLQSLLHQYTDGAMLLALGFFFGAFAVAFLAIFSSISAVTGEAEHGVLQSVLARPLPRWRWYLGRWLGFTVFGLLYAGLLYALIVLIVAYRTGISLDGLTIFKSYLLFGSVVPLLVTVTMLGSIWLSPLGNGIGMTMLFAMSWLGGMIEKLLGSELLRNEAMRPLQTISGLISLAMPADALQQRMLAELLSLSDFQQLTNLNNHLGPFALASIPSNSFLIYAAAYTLVLMAAGIWAIRKRDF